jgi:hypothetical protein
MSSARARLCVLRHGQSQTMSPTISTQSPWRRFVLYHRILPPSKVSFLLLLLLLLLEPLSPIMMMNMSTMRDKVIAQPRDSGASPFHNMKIRTIPLAAKRKTHRLEYHSTRAVIVLFLLCMHSCFVSCLVLCFSDCFFFSLIS